MSNSRAYFVKFLERLFEEYFWHSFILCRAKKNILSLLKLRALLLCVPSPSLHLYFCICICIWCQLKLVALLLRALSASFGVKTFLTFGRFCSCFVRALQILLSLFHLLEPKLVLDVQCDFKVTKAYAYRLKSLEYWNLHCCNL